MQRVDRIRFDRPPWQRWVLRRRLSIAILNLVLMLCGLALLQAPHHDERIRWVGTAMFLFAVCSGALIRAAERRPPHG
jgi:hypothetical protein